MATVDIPLPDATGREELLTMCLKDEKLEGVDIPGLAKLLEGYSGHDITLVCRDAALMGFRRKSQGLTPSEIRAIPKCTCVFVSG